MSGPKGRERRASAYHPTFQYNLSEGAHQIGLLGYKIGYRPLPMAIWSKTGPKSDILEIFENSVSYSKFFRVSNFEKSPYYRLGPSSDTDVPDRFRTLPFYSIFFGPDVIPFLAAVPEIMMTSCICSGDR